MTAAEFDGTEERRIRCVMCREPIAYPPEMEGNEIPCPHCDEEILLLMSDTVIFRKEDLAADKAAYEEAMRRKAEVESQAEESAAAGHGPVIGQRIKVKTGRGAIPHLIEPVPLVDGPRQSVTLTHLLHPHRFVVWKGGLAVTRRPDMIAIQWAISHDQAARARPVPELRLAFRLKGEPSIGAVSFSTGGTDLPCELGGQGQDEKGSTVLTGAFPDDRFLQLCGALASGETVAMAVTGTDVAMPDKKWPDFKNYTLEFYEALRRRFGYYFK